MNYSKWVYVGKVRRRPHGYILFSVGEDILWKIPFLFHDIFDEEDEHIKLTLFLGNDQSLNYKDIEGLFNYLTDNFWENDVWFSKKYEWSRNFAFEKTYLLLYIPRGILTNFRKNVKLHLLFRCRKKLCKTNISFEMQFSDKGFEKFTEKMIEIML